jgi:hypothetical protein
MVEFSLRLDAEAAVQLTTHVLEQHQLRVVRNFDLRNALHSQDTPCTCPHHGTAECECNYVVLLAYDMTAPGRRPQPAGQIVIHSHDGTTWLSVPAANDGRRVRKEPQADRRLLQVVAEVMVGAAV